MYSSSKVPRVAGGNIPDLSSEVSTVYACSIDLFSLVTGKLLSLGR